MQIKLGKNYKTRGGLAVRIYSVGNGGEMPVHGAMEVSTGHWQVGNWKEYGSHWSESQRHPLDLIEVKPEHTMWINCYGHCAASHMSRNEADIAAGPERLACMPITFREGDGL